MTRAEADAHWARHFHDKAKRLQAENQRLRNAVALLNSMILSNEGHTETSRAVVREAVRTDVEEAGKE